MVATVAKGPDSDAPASPGFNDAEFAAKFAAELHA
jgi:hypothetical protein